LRTAGLALEYPIERQEQLPLPKRDPCLSVAQNQQADHSALARRLLPHLQAAPMQGRPEQSALAPVAVQSAQDQCGVAALLAHLQSPAARLIRVDLAQELARPTQLQHRPRPKGHKRLAYAPFYLPTFLRIRRSPFAR